MPFEKSETVSLASSVMKNIVAPSALLGFPVKLICCITFGSASSFVVYLNLSQFPDNIL